MVMFPAATFLIGEATDRTQHGDEIKDAPVTIATFELARYPVTNAQYALFMANDGYNPERGWWDDAGRAWLQKSRQTKPGDWNNDRFDEARPNHPVVGVSWYEASAFCRWLTQQKQNGYVYRLPSEAEWEYAARGTDRRPYPWGLEEPDAECANFGQICNGTTAIGCFTSGATNQHIHDLAGNVLEWTASVYGDYAEGLASEWQTPADVANKHFTLRGGGWYDPPLVLRASYRDNYAPVDHRYFVGFRLARHLPENVKN